MTVDNITRGTTPPLQAYTEFSAPQPPQLNNDNNHILVNEILNHILTFTPASELCRLQRVCDSFKNVINEKKEHAEYIKDIKENAKRIYKLIKNNLNTLKTTFYQNPFSFSFKNNIQRTSPIIVLLPTENGNERKIDTISSIALYLVDQPFEMPLPRKYLNNTFKLSVKATFAYNRTLLKIAYIFLCFVSTTLSIGSYIIHILSRNSGTKLSSLHKYFFNECQKSTISFLQSVLRYNVLDSKNLNFCVDIKKTSKKIALEANENKLLDIEESFSIFKTREDKKFIELCLKYLNENILYSFSEVIDIENQPISSDSVSAKQNTRIQQQFLTYLFGTQDNRKTTIEKVFTLLQKCKSAISNQQTMNNSKKNLDLDLKYLQSELIDCKEELLNLSVISLQELNSINRKLQNLIKQFSKIFY